MANLNDPQMLSQQSTNNEIIPLKPTVPLAVHLQMSRPHNHIDPKRFVLSRSLQDDKDHNQDNHQDHQQHHKPNKPYNYPKLLYHLLGISLGLGSSGQTNCSYKTFYIVWLGVGVAVYMIIFFVYTRKLVLRYYDFSWYLAEAIALGVYSIVLLIVSIISFWLIGRSVFAIVLGRYIVFPHFANHAMRCFVESIVTVRSVR